MDLKKTSGNKFRKENKKKDKIERPKSSYIKRKLIKGPDFDKTIITY